MTTAGSVVLVEGESDRLALHAVAARLGRDLEDEGVEVVAMGGITNTRAFVTRHGRGGVGSRIAGLYDAPEEAQVRHGLAAAGVTLGGRGSLSDIGFFACTADLEDELIRALGVDRAEEVIDAAGETRSLRLLAGMPAQRGWTRRQVLRRFLGSQAGRKARYAGLFVAALEPGREPAPLLSVLSRT